MTDAKPTDPHPTGQTLGAAKRESRAARAQRVLAALVAGASLDEIRDEEKISRKRAEAILREELRRRWVAPAKEYARLQIARLEGMLLKLVDRVDNGELDTIDRALKIVDRLDRYHGFAKGERTTEQYNEAHRAHLLKKLNEMAGRIDAEKAEAAAMQQG
jgi:hypothetical protein